MLQPPLGFCTQNWYSDVPPHVAVAVRVTGVPTDVLALGAVCSATALHEAPLLRVKPRPVQVSYAALDADALIQT